MGEGEGGMFQENSIETCILSRVKQITSPGWMNVNALCVKKFVLVLNIETKGKLLTKEFKTDILS